MLNRILRTIEKFIPKTLYRAGQPIYHYGLAFLGALLYRFPSRKIYVVGVTGTKGKTSTVELINAILEEAGYKTALAGTLRFKVGGVSERNMHKMTLPGRFFLQKFLRRAVREDCDYAIVELTSEGARQFRHVFVSLDALVFTNLAPEHIESHGSFEKYAAAKLSLARALEKSKKKHTAIIANTDDAYGEKFLSARADKRLPYALKDAKPYRLEKKGLYLTLDNTRIHARLSGVFNIYNILAAATFAKSRHIGTETIRQAVERFRGIPGRVEYIDAGQDFTVVVDYAHTPDSLEKLYDTFHWAQRICVLGSTGGGRDKWKRAEMGAIANRYCSRIILTNEDPYDEDPESIVADIKKGIGKPIVEIIMDRREAIREALARAKTGDAVLITGKGTDPYIMQARGGKLPWSDAAVAREEMNRLINTI